MYECAYIPADHDIQQDKLRKADEAPLVDLVRRRRRYRYRRLALILGIALFLDSLRQVGSSLRHMRGTDDVLDVSSTGCLVRRRHLGRSSGKVEEAIDGRWRRPWRGSAPRAARKRER